MKIKRKVFLIPFFLLISLLCNISKTYAIAYEDVYLYYDSINFVELYNNYEIVEHVIDLVEQYNTRGFPTAISYGYINGKPFLQVGVEQKVPPNNFNLRFLSKFTYDTSNQYYYQNSVSSFNDLTNYSCYYGSYGQTGQNCSYRTLAFYLDDMADYQGGNLNLFYSKIPLMFTQNIYNDSYFMTGNYGGNATTYFPTANYIPYSLSTTYNFSSFVWTNYDLLYMKMPNSGTTPAPVHWNFIKDLYLNDNVINEGDVFPTYDTYINSLVSGITFTSQSFTTSNGVIYKKIISIDYGRIDNELYDYYLLDTRYNLWNKLDLSSVYPIKTIDAFSNYVLYAEVRDKEGNVLTSGSYAITDIETDLNIRFEELKNYDVYGENYGNVINIFYTSDNRSDYTYRYKILNLYSDFETDFINVKDIDSSVSINLFNSSVIYAEILDSNDNILYNVSFTSRIDNEGALPRINFKDFKNLEYEQYVCDFGTSCGHQCVNSLDIIIDYGVLDDSKYSYQYSFDGENWFDVSLSCNSIDDYTSCTSYSFNITNNELIIGRVISKDDDSVVALSTYQTTSIGTCNADNSIDTSKISIDSSFKYFSNPIKSFLDLFTYFWNHLPSVLKLFFVFIFALIVILFAFRFLL